MKKMMWAGVSIGVGTLLFVSIVISNRCRRPIYLRDDVKVSFDETYVPPVNLYIQPTEQQTTSYTNIGEKETLQIETPIEEEQLSLDSVCIENEDSYGILSELNYRYIIRDILLMVNTESLPVTSNLVSNLDKILVELPEFNANSLSVIQGAGSFESRYCLVRINGVVYSVTFMLDDLGDIAMLSLEVNE